MSLIPYMGGKSFIAKWIVSHFPPHKTYVEVFGGGASVLFTKPKSEIEIYNDLWKNAVTFFRVLRNDCEGLIKALRNLPYSRVEHKRLYKLMFNDELKNDLDVAVAFFYLANVSFAGMLDGTFGTSKLRNHALTYKRKVDSLETFSERLREVLFECLDFRECIKKYDGENTLFYLDPPYLNRKRTYYLPKFGYRDHYELAKILRGIKGKAVVSHYESEEIRKLYEGWDVSEKVVPVFCTFWENIEKRPHAKELLFMNFDPTKEGVVLKRHLEDVFG